MVHWGSLIIGLVMGGLCTLVVMSFAKSASNADDILYKGDQYK